MQVGTCAEVCIACVTNLNRADGSLYMFTPVDPLFLVIDCLFEAPRRFLPASQLFSDLYGRVKRSGMATPGVTSSKGSASLAGNTWEAAAVNWVQDTLPAISSKQLNLIMEVNTSMGEGTPLFKLSDAKMASWLATKAVVAARHLAATSEEQGTLSAMSASFSLTSSAVDGPASGGEAPDSGDDKEVSGGGSLPTSAWLEEGLDLIAEYVADAPLALARARLGLVADIVAPTVPPSSVPGADSAAGGEGSASAAGQAASLQRAAAWASAGDGGSSIIDPSKYRAASEEGSSALGGTKRPAEAAQSSAAKRLAKTDTRGMKSMTSFFKTKK